LLAACFLSASAVTQQAGATAVKAAKRLRIRNGCGREPIWIAHEAGASIGPDKQNVKIEPDHTVEFLTTPGLSATRYWPKMGCDGQGDHCTLGGSGGPGEACVRRPPEVQQDDYSSCAPPIDTKFEGTFGSEDMPCSDQAGVQGCDYIDMSLVDGWTLPFKLTLTGTCTSAKGVQTNLEMDCSGLTFDKCPTKESLTAADDLVTDLRAVNPHTGQVAGCYAPCQKLVSGKWNNSEAHGRHHTDPQVAPYCCPTPPESPEMCRAGPITKTTYLKEVHHRCPGVYGYAYDDGMGLLRCTPTTTYDLTFFCPDDKTNFAKVAAEKREKEKEAAKVAEEKEAAKRAKKKEADKIAEEANKRAKEKLVKADKLDSTGVPEKSSDGVVETAKMDSSLKEKELNSTRTTVATVAEAKFEAPLRQPSLASAVGHVLWRQRLTQVCSLSLLGCTAALAALLARPTRRLVTSLLRRRSEGSSARVPGVSVVEAEPAPAMPLLHAGDDDDGSRYDSTGPLP